MGCVWGGGAQHAQLGVLQRQALQFYQPKHMVPISALNLKSFISIYATYLLSFLGSTAQIFPNSIFSPW